MRKKEKVNDEYLKTVGNVQRKIRQQIQAEIWLWHLLTKGQASLAGTYSLRFHLQFNEAFSKYFRIKQKKFIIKGSWQSQEEIHLEMTEIFHSAFQSHTFQSVAFPHRAIRLVKIGGGQVQMTKSPLTTHLEQVQLNIETNLEGKIRGRRVKKG